jgi:hypothetical protein
MALTDVAICNVKPCEERYKVLDGGALCIEVYTEGREVHRQIHNTYPD